MVTEAFAALGVDLNSTPLLADMVREAGFVNVTTQLLIVPIGPWAQEEVLKTTGLRWGTILMDGLQSVALGPLTRGLGWTPEKVEIRLLKTRKAYADDMVHSFMPLYIICGQKPQRKGYPNYHVSS